MNVGPTSWEVKNSIFNMKNDYNNFETTKPIGRKEKRYSSEELKIDDEIFAQKVLLGPFVFDNLKESDMMTQI